ncbi:MAG: hypothetical protein HFE86_05455 [Clostridiales bacterium]|nr:hypothetical protein [Clostridiales bacterium]
MTEEIYTNEAHISLSRQAAGEGMVLLENNGARPIPEQETVAIFGCGQIRFQKGGGGSGDVDTLYVHSLLDGMRMKEAEGKLTVYAPLAEAYTAYTKEHEEGEMPLEAADVKQAARRAQTAAVTITRYSAEGWDRNSGKGDFLLSEDERDMLQKVKDAGFRKTIAALNIGGVIDTSWFQEYDVDAVMLAWQAGIEGGLAAADILVGDVNPSGKPTDTFAGSYEDYPSSATFSESDHSDYINHTDDIFVGYRYFETVPGAGKRYCIPSATAFPIPILPCPPPG